MFDKQFKTLLRNGQPEAFKEIYRILFPRLKGYCRLFVRNENEVQDIIQECFLTLWEKRSEIDPEKSVESYLFVILRNRCLNYLKELKSKAENINLEKVEVAELQYLYQLDFTEKEEISLEEQLIVSFKEAVESLPSKMRQIFIKCKIEGKKQKDVAKELGISIKTIEKHINTAKHYIIKKLNRQYIWLTFLIMMWIVERPGKSDQGVILPEVGSPGVVRGAGEAEEKQQSPPRAILLKL